MTQFASDWIYPGEYQHIPVKPQIRIILSTPNLKPINPEDPPFKGDTRYIVGDWNTTREALDYWEENKEDFLSHRDPSIPLRVFIQVFEITDTVSIIDYIPPNPLEKE